MSTFKRGELADEDREKRVLIRSATDLHSIQRMDADELLDLQRKLGYGDVWGVWQVPEHWVKRCLESDRQLRYSDDGEDKTQASAETLRVVLLLTLTPNQKNKFLSPATAVSYGRVLYRVSMECSKRSQPIDGWWSRVSYTEMREIIKKFAVRLDGSLRRLYHRGFIADVPGSVVQDEDAQERDRQGETLLEQDQDTSREWQPLPDEYTAQCGQRCLWIVKHLGPTLLDCLEACAEWRPSSGRMSLESRTKRSRTSTKAQAAKKIVEGWCWTGPNGKPISRLPFAIHINVRTASPQYAKQLGVPVSVPLSWPPETYDGLLKLIALLQSCHLWLFLLSSGPRWSTAASYNVDSLVEAPADGSVPDRIKGSKFKNTHQLGGEKRDWPVPPVLVQAFRQQARLATLVRRLEHTTDPDSLGNALWLNVSGRLGRRGQTKLSANHDLDGMADVFGLRHLLDSENPRVHSHRFRKTLARMIALAMSSAQIILMDCFGHDDPDQTIRYILADKAIAADVIRMQRELTILMGVDAINNADKISGAMGETIREEVYRFQRVTGKGKLDPEDVYELADKLTHGGRTWMQVAPGVICTAPAMVSGPCGIPRGVHTDPSNCQSVCKMRLVLPDRLALLDDNLAALLTDLQRALDEDNQMLAVCLVSQIQNQWFETPYTYEKWKDHPLIVARCDHTKKPYWTATPEK